MSRPYKVSLPESFPWLMRVDDRDLESYVDGMMEGLKRGVSGSFAVTADAPTGYAHVWMSDTTKDYLVNLYDIYEAKDAPEGREAGVDYELLLKSEEIEDHG